MLPTTSTDGDVTVRTPPSHLSWIGTRPGLPYFVGEHGEAWTPVGHNEAVAWPALAGIFMRRDIAGAERHLRELKASGVTCLRLMLEYGQGEHRYLERPAGSFVPNMVRWWDDLFRLCEAAGLRLLLTPFDTFFLWRRWRHHPYRAANGGPCASRGRFLVCPATRAAIKARLAFATRRWGASPALFGWDLWNELKPQWAGGDCAALHGFVEDVGGFLRALETRLHGRAHPQTASVFMPDLTAHPALAETAFRHPRLDFASPHCYDRAAIDAPRGSAAPALAMAQLVGAAIAETRDGRPVFDSEHGPIGLHARRRMLRETVDDEMFRRMQWAHLAAGGAGGGMRWPYRHPHRLTPGMHAAQRALAGFLPLVDWARLEGRRNLTAETTASVPVRGVDVVACGTGDRAVAWLLRRRAAAGGYVHNGFAGSAGEAPRQRPADVRSGPDGAATARGSAVSFELPGLVPGCYRVTAFDPIAGRVVASWPLVHDDRDACRIEVRLASGELALVVAPTGAPGPPPVR